MGPGSAAVVLLMAVMQDALCKTWDITQPERIAAISDSCVAVPCRFSVPADQEANILNCSDSGIWKRGSLHGPIVLNSLNPSTNVLQGKVLGDLKKKNCTTVFHSFPKNYSDAYFFRLDCPNVKYSFLTGVSVVAQAEPAAPQLILESLLFEGAQVRLRCSAPVPCPMLPPTISWLPHDSYRQESTQMLQSADGQMTMTSTLTFIASANHHNQSFTCAVSYPLSQGGSTATSVKSQRLNVLYAPRFTVAALYTLGPVSEGRAVTFTCSSDANPPVSRYTWYRDDGGVMTEMGQGHKLVLTVSQADSGAYLCEAHTSRGSHRSRTVSLEVYAASGGFLVDFLAHHFIISGFLLLLLIVTVVTIVVKYRSLSKRLEAVEQREENHYVNLKAPTCSASPDYDQLQAQKPKKKSFSEASDYENVQGRSIDQPQPNQT